MSANINSAQCRPEVWGGIECTINRIGNKFRDQLGYSGHYWRYNDIYTFSKLGITHLRYPILWERHQNTEHASISWMWAARQLKAIVDSGMVPVVGLLHHGSGPAFTNLCDKDFPEKFARYARAVALRFPWLTHYVPINEPLTTARFSCLYGHWYPHKQSDEAFCRALINQAKATVLAMREIRRINPNAQLIQTEDLAKVHSTEVLKYQADFENERRWLTYDLLCGMVHRYHPLWNYLINSGITPEELEFFAMNQCPPTIIGHNYYVTSERYLDDNIEMTPAEKVGGNGRHQYIDTEAYRAGCAEGLTSLVTESWERYRLPVAMTETHLGCTCDEQIRWLMEVWESCIAMKERGIDIRAVTAWSLLGAYDWDSLLTKWNMTYECGAFDSQGRSLKKTQLAAVIESLARTGAYSDPLLETQGWWRQIVSQAMVA